VVNALKDPDAVKTSVHCFIDRRIFPIALHCNRSVTSLVALAIYMHLGLKVPLKSAISYTFLACKAVFRRKKGRHPLSSQQSICLI